MKVIFLLIMLFRSIELFAQESQSCFPRILGLGGLNNKSRYIHLYEKNDYSGVPLIKFEDKFYLFENNTYSNYNLVNGKKLNADLEKKFPFLKQASIYGVIMLYCPYRNDNEFYVEFFDKKLYFKMEKKLLESMFQLVNVTFYDSDTIRNLLLKISTYQKTLKDFNGCLDRQGEGCVRKEDEKSAKLMLFMVDSFIETDCKKEMPEMTSFDEKKKYQFRKGVIDKAKSIMNTNNEFSVKYFLKLSSSKEFRYNFEMYSSDAYLCKDRSFDGIDVRYVVDKKKKGYFEFEYPSTSPNLTDSKGPYYYDED